MNKIKQGRRPPGRPYYHVRGDPADTVARPAKSQSFFSGQTRRLRPAAPAYVKLHYTEQATSAVKGLIS